MITDVRQEVVYQQTAVNKHSKFVTDNIKSYTDGFINNSSLSILYTQSSLAAVDQLSAFSHNSVHAFRSCSNSLAPFVSYNDSRGFWSQETIPDQVIVVSGYVLEARVWFDNVSNNTRVIFATNQNDGVNPSQLGWALCLEGATHVLTLYVGTFAVGGKTTTTKRLMPYKWNTITAEVDQDTDSLTVYIDGMKYHEFAGSLAGLDYAWHYPVFGDYITAGTEAYTLRGIQHHCRIWTREIWQSEGSKYVTSSLKSQYRGPITAGIAPTRVREFSFIPVSQPTPSTRVFNLYPITTETVLANYLPLASYLEPIDPNTWLLTVPCDPLFVSEGFLLTSTVKTNAPYDTRKETLFSSSVSLIMSSHSPDPAHTFIRWPIHPSSTAYISLECQGPLVFAKLPGNQYKPYTPSSCCGLIDPVTGVMAINSSFSSVFSHYYDTAANDTKWNIETVLSNHYTQVWLDFVIPDSYASSNHGTIYYSDVPQSQDLAAHCAHWSSKMLLPTPQVVKVAAERY